MLYDQAQLASAYLEPTRSRATCSYETVARDILDYVRRDLTATRRAAFTPPKTRTA